MTTTNPASRLLEALHRLMNLPNGQNMRCKQVWQMAFDLREGDDGALADVISDVHDLVRDTKAALSASGVPDLDLYLASFPAIEKILNLDNLVHGWQQFLEQLKQPHVMQGLRFCEAHLRTVSQETVIDSATLNNLMADAIDAMNSISKDTSLPPDLRELLIEHLQSIQRAIASYRVRGGQAIKHSVERAIGGLMAHRDLLKGQEKSRGVVRFVTVIEKTSEAIEGVTGFARKGFALAAAVKDGIKLLN